MARVRFTGPPNPGPDGTELGHTVPAFGRTVRPDELVEIPGDLVEEGADGWTLGDPDQDPEQDTGRYVLPKTLWQVEGPPKARRKKTEAKTSDNAEAQE